MEKSQREFLLRQQLNAIRKDSGTGRGAEDYRARVEAADVPDAVREALPRGRQAGRSSDQNPSRRGSARGSTQSSTSRGTSARPTTPTSPAPGRCSTLTTTASKRSKSGSSSTSPSGAARSPRPRGRGRPRIRCRGAARRPARHGQDLARRECRACAWTEVRPVALGGVRDEAEIRGHRRTARWRAQPDRPAIKEAGSMNRWCSSTRWTRSGRTTAEIQQRRWRCWTRLRTTPSATTTSRLDLDLSDVLFIAGERGRVHPLGVARPDGARHARRLHRGRQGRDRARLPAAAPAGRPR